MMWDYFSFVFATCFEKSRRLNCECFYRFDSGLSKVFLSIMEVITAAHNNKSLSSRYRSHMVTWLKGQISHFCQATKQ